MCVRVCLSVCVCVRVCVQRGATDVLSSHVNTPSGPTSCYAVLNCDVSEGPKSDSSESFPPLAGRGSAALCCLLAAAAAKPFCRNPTNLDRGNSVTRSLPAQTPKPKAGAAAPSILSVCVRDLMTAARHPCAVSFY